MSNVEPPPDSPSEWLEYANSDIVATIPSRANRQKDDEKRTEIQRDVYLDASTVLTAPTNQLYLYTDVLAFTKQETVISPPAYGLIQIVARVLTADNPINLKFVTAGDDGCVVWIYASMLDQPITVSSGTSKPITLTLGLETGNAGVFLTVQPNAISTEYVTDFAAVTREEFQASLETQLRLAQVLFWRKTSIAISLCAYVATVTAHPPSNSEINAQAVALGQQLAAQAMTGPNASYAPALVLESYKATVRDALDAVAAFEEQYHRFQDKKENLDIQLQAWDAMLQQAVNRRMALKFLRDSAFAKYMDVQEVVGECLEQFSGDTEELDEAKKKFDQGLREWNTGQMFLALFKIFKGIIGTSKLADPYSPSRTIPALTNENSDFAFGIGKISQGDPTGFLEAIGAIEEGIAGVKDGEQTEHDASIKSDTLEALGNCMKAIESLYPAVYGVVQAVHALEANPEADIPSITDISGTSQGDENAALIVTLAAWDRWVLESDEQMQFAVDKEIGGASEYRLALRKHAINGKQLAQITAEAVKSGQEYVQAAMNVVLCDKDIKALKELRETYTGQEEIYAQAEAKFFDRFLTMRTSLVIELRNLVWAYKYWALADSQVILDSEKSTADFRADLFFIDTEVETASSRYSTDFQPFKYTVHSKDLPADYGQMMIEGLRGDTHSARFTLVPSDALSRAPNFASVFTEGSHFRLDGLDVVLRGAVPAPDAIQDGKVAMDMQISTSGVYADIQDGDVYHFTSLPRSVRFSYDLTESGDQGDTHIYATWPSVDHAKPTPFTQWTITLRHPERLDLSGLTGVDLIWTGNARFDDPRGIGRRGGRNKKLAKKRVAGVK
ncbi:hypothetical protein F5Y07DRAFT_403944 [Xylaria sp. FL0933]|nr:hypothetical protein F5Y07DRAFT_403944 [Xylaria sp. FL0933]